MPLAVNNAKQYFSNEVNADNILYVLTSNFFYYYNLVVEQLKFSHCISSHKVKHDSVKYFQNLITSLEDMEPPQVVYL